MDLGDEEQGRAKSTDEPEVMGRLGKVRTSRGRAGLVPWGDESRELNEIKGKGKGKGNEGKGEHEGKEGGFGRKGFQQSVKEADEEDERDRVAPDIGAGGSHPQATSDPGKEEKEKKETRVLRWADCDDEEVKENEEEGDKAMGDDGGETAGSGREQKARERRRAQEALEEERRAHEAREQKRAQEAREDEERRAQETREEERRAQEAREQTRAQKAREEE